MRLLIVGSLDGHITAAGKIALSRGAKVAHVDDVDQAMHALRNGQGADLIMFDVALDTQRMIDSLRTERINIPVVACGIGTSAEHLKPFLSVNSNFFTITATGEFAGARKRIYATFRRNQNGTALLLDWHED